MAKDYDIIWFDLLDSTNNRISAVREMLPSGTVFATSRQSAGRGQKGNRWISADGENITFSLLYKRDLKADEQFRISMAASLAVVGFLREKGIDARVKWPNDIYVGERKICGMLIEHSIRNDKLSSSIIGIGLNLNQRTFDPSLPNPTSISLILGRGFDPKEEMESIVSHLHRTLNRDISESELEAEYVNLLYHKDELHEYLDCRKAVDSTLTATDRPVEGGVRFKGKIRGISRYGLLKVETEKGKPCEEFAFKEIRYLRD